jgi:amino-acid N-acetyltransferase
MVTLRSAAQQDAGIIRRLVQQARINPTGLDWQRFIVAETETGQVIGCAQIKPHQDGTRELASLVVIPEWRGKGVARALIEDFIAREKETLYLMCRAGLIPFYTKFGFKALRPEEMPAYYRRMYNIVRFLNGLFRKSTRLAIMRRAGK